MNHILLRRPVTPRILALDPQATPYNLEYETKLYPVSQPSSIEDEDVPEGEDSENPNYTPSKAEELESGLQWIVKNFREIRRQTGQRGPVADTP